MQSTTKQRTISRIGILVVALLAVFAVSSIAKNMFSWRIVLYPTMKMNSKQGIDKAKAMVDEMHKFGYNAIFVDDSRMRKLGNIPQYKADIQNFVTYSRAKGIEVVPMAQGQLGTPDMDEGQREAFAAIGTPFIVRGGIAVPQGDPAAAILNGGFERALDSWKKAGPFSVDKSVKRSGTASARCDNPKTSNLLISQVVNVKPHRTYELSAWIKSRNVVSTKGDPNQPMRGTMFKVLDLKGRILLANRDWFGVKPNTDWAPFKQKFNSQQNTQVKILLCASGYQAYKGQAWFDDVAMREVGLYQTAHKPSMPVVVKNAQGQILKAGKDYIVGNERLTIPSGSSAQNGELLLVDWATDAANIVTKEAFMSFCDNRVWDITRQHIKTQDEWFLNPPARLMKYSEWRLGGYDPACMAKYNIASRGCGRYFAATANYTDSLYKEANCARVSFIFNDAYDPYHNAKNPFYAVNGGAIGAGHSLSTDIIVLNWNVHGRKDALRYFAGMDPTRHGSFGVKKSVHRQIISSGVGSWTQWLQFLTAVEKEGMPDGRVIGMAYHNYKSQYSMIGAMATACKAAGRWETGPAPIPQATPGCGAGIDRSHKAAVQSTYSLSVVQAPGKTSRILRYSVPANENVQIGIFNLMGKQVKKVLNEEMASGNYERKIDLSDMAAGIYFVRLTTASQSNRHSLSHKLVVF